MDPTSPNFVDFSSWGAASSAENFLDALLGEERRKTGSTKAEALAIRGLGCNRRSTGAPAETPTRCSTSCPFMRRRSWPRPTLYSSSTRPVSCNRAMVLRCRTAVNRSRIVVLASSPARSRRAVMPSSTAHGIHANLDRRSGAHGQGECPARDHAPCTPPPGCAPACQASSDRDFTLRATRPSARPLPAPSQPLGRKGDHLAQNISIGPFATMARRFIISSLIVGFLVNARFLPPRVLRSKPRPQARKDRSVAARLAPRTCSCARSSRDAQKRDASILDQAATAEVRSRLNGVS